jgi:hypothetical protein
MKMGYSHHSKTLWRISDPKLQRVKSQSEVVFDEKRNAHMSCQHGSNQIDMFGLPEDEEYVEETDTADDPLQASQLTQTGSQSMQIRRRSKSHMHEEPNKYAENTHSQSLRREDQTSQHSAANAENIAHSPRLCREDQTARGLAAATTKSSQVPPAAPDLMIWSRVTRSQGINSADALKVSTASVSNGSKFLVWFRVRFRPRTGPLQRVLTQNPLLKSEHLLLQLSI